MIPLKKTPPWSISFEDIKTNKKLIFEIVKENENLKKFNLSSNIFLEQDIIEFSKILETNTSLKSINFSYNTMETKMLKKLCNSQKKIDA